MRLSYRKPALLTFALLLVFAPVIMSAALARADEATAKPMRVIHGNPVDRRAVEALLDESVGDAEVKIGRGKVKELKGKFRIDKNKPVEEAALDFIDRHRNAFGLKDPKRELKQSGTKAEYGAHYQQEYNGVPIWLHSMSVYLDKDHDVREVIANTVPTPDIDTTPLITAEEAIDFAKAELKIPPAAKVWPTSAELNIYEDKLAYQVIIGEWRYFIDAKNGNILYKDSLANY
ncbi:MAG: PepSY domain-containing protein [Nitrospirae bacterium]|nr:PepSY domain-containing protein [Nitrospirota bacterium]